MAHTAQPCELQVLLSCGWQGQADGPIIMVAPQQEQHWVYTAKSLPLRS